MEVGDDYLKTVGLIIAGDGVEAASIVIGRTIKSEEKVTTVTTPFEVVPRRTGFEFETSSSVAFKLNT